MAAVLNDFTQFLTLVRYLGDGPISIPLVDPYDGSEFDPAGHTLIFTLKADETDEDVDALVGKISTLGGITVANPAVVTLLPDDFAAIVARKSYEFDIQAEHPTTHALKTVARGHLRFNYDVTRQRLLSIPTIIVPPSDPLETFAGELMLTFGGELMLAF